MRTKIIFFPGFPVFATSLGLFLDKLREERFLVQAKGYNQRIKPASNEKYVLMGYSAGAVGALSFAKGHSKNVDKIILIDPAGFPPPRNFLSHVWNFRKESRRLPASIKMELKAELGRDSMGKKWKSVRQIISFDLIKEIEEAYLDKEEIYIVKSIWDLMFSSGRNFQLPNDLNLIKIAGNGHFGLIKNYRRYKEAINDIF
ncbi:MAG: hypothetical protein U5L10_02570 [Candidatus Moranbacteria bacterium]|nr:hypothetical protein [Candidatus Moranbacteria bacterium]